MGNAIEKACPCIPPAIPDDIPPVKLLLLGTGESGKSTVFKQMKLQELHGGAGFSEDTKKYFADKVRGNLYKGIKQIAEYLCAEQIPLRDESRRSSLEHVIQYQPQPEQGGAAALARTQSVTSAATEDFYSPGAFDSEFFEHVRSLWEDEAVKEVASQAAVTDLNDSAPYFLDKLDNIASDDYVPDDQDIVRCRMVTRSLDEITFNVADGRNNVPFLVYDFGGQRALRPRLVTMFGNIDCIIFVADISSFDQDLREAPGVRRIAEARDFLKCIWENPFLSQVSVCLFLNKVDILEEKIETGGTDHLRDLFSHYDEFQPTEQEVDEFLKQYNTISLSRMANQARGSRVSAAENVPPNRTSRSSSGARSFFYRRPSDDVIKAATFLKNVFTSVFDEAFDLPDNMNGGHVGDQKAYEYYYTVAVDCDNIKQVMKGCKRVLIRQHMQRWFSGL